MNTIASRASSGTLTRWIVILCTALAARSNSACFAKACTRIGAQTLAAAGGVGIAINIANSSWIPSRSTLTAIAASPLRFAATATDLMGHWMSCAHPVAAAVVVWMTIDGTSVLQIVVVLLALVTLFSGVAIFAVASAIASRTFVAAGDAWTCAVAQLVALWTIPTRITSADLFSLQVHSAAQPSDLSRWDIRHRSDLEIGHRPSQVQTLNTSHL